MNIISFMHLLLKHFNRQVSDLEDVLLNIEPFILFLPFVFLLRTPWYAPVLCKKKKGGHDRAYHLQCLNKIVLVLSAVTSPTDGFKGTT